MIGTKKGSQITVSRDFVMSLNARIDRSMDVLENYGYREDLCIAFPSWLLHILSTMPYYPNFQHAHSICYTSIDDARWFGCKLYPNYKNEIAVYHKDMPFNNPDQIQIIQIEKSTQ